MDITNLGEPLFPSPLRRFVSDTIRLPEQIIDYPDRTAQSELSFEVAGPRAKLFFNHENTRAGIVTCGGLCPGLNNVIRSLFLELYYAYDVKDVLGFRGDTRDLIRTEAGNPLYLHLRLWTPFTRKGERSLALQEDRWTLLKLLTTL